MQLSDNEKRDAIRLIQDGRSLHGLVGTSLRMNGNHLG